MALDHVDVHGSFAATAFHRAWAVPPLQRGGRYEVLGVVRSSETLELLVLYRPLDSDIGMWVRPDAMFVEQVEVQGIERPRFEFVE